MSLQWFVGALVHRPFIVLAAIALLAIISIAVPCYQGEFPSFADPTMGFETRGTPLAQRIVAWRNFYEAMQPYGALTGNPHEYLTYSNETALLMANHTMKKQHGVMVHRKRRPKGGGKRKKTSQAHGKVITEVRNVTDRSHTRWIQLHKLLSNTSNDKYMRMEREFFFCGPPDDNYVQFVLKSDGDEDLFNLEALFKICRIETELMKIDLYMDLCLENDKLMSNCCRPWSLPNYVALLSDRPNCLALTEHDVNATLNLLMRCASYYHRGLLDPTCIDAGECMGVPIECRQYDAVYIILNYLTSTTFIPTAARNKLQETLIFLPMARSVATLPFYAAVERMTPLDYRGVAVVAMEFGAKNELFDQILVRDARLMLLGGCFVIVCMWTYTGSAFLTLMTVAAISASLASAYFLYAYVFGMRFFPFMNLLAVVVVIGIGADDAFIFCKLWHTMKASNHHHHTLFQTMTRTLYHALIAMFVTSITTAIAFLASYLSSITAIRCFGVFAGTAILMNYLLMVTWLPASVVVWEQFPYECACFQQLKQALVERYQCTLARCPSVSRVIEHCSRLDTQLVEVIIRFKYATALGFTLIAVGASVIVFYYPRFAIQRTNELQLFESHHLFEQYDLVYKQKFAFKRAAGRDADTYLLHLPLRFIWGILPVDNGDQLDPKSVGTLELDDAFDIAQPEAQSFLLRFCRELQQQHFFRPTPGAMLTNCAIETFTAWMNRPCADPIDADVNRFPCCNESTFPYDADVFQACIVDAQSDLHQTPPAYLTPTTAGLRFTKTEVPKLAALVVEYDSNYTYEASYEELETFLADADAWLHRQLAMAPVGMQQAFFVSDLEFFDLQRALPANTLLAVSVSMTLALIVLFAATCNVVHSLLAVFTIACSMLTIMATLVLLGWKLNILESVAISSTIGFAVDYCLHYAVNHKLEREARACMLAPTAMGALTTGAAGALMMPSAVLAYKQIGQFMVVVTTVSWAFATGQLVALMAIAGDGADLSGMNYSVLGARLLHKWRLKRGKPRSASAAVDASEAESLAVRYDNVEPKEGCSSGGGGSGGVHVQKVAAGAEGKQAGGGGGGALLSQSPSNSAITFITTEDNQY